MTFRAFVMAACVFAGCARPDPLSGTWAGEFIAQGRPKPTPMTFLLKFDGKETVSGTFVGLPEPGDVTKGTINAESGTLMLALGAQKAEDVLLTLEGTGGERRREGPHHWTNGTR